MLLSILLACQQGWMPVRLFTEHPVFLQAQPANNFTMELTGPAVEQLASQSGNSDQFKQALASLLPGISKHPHIQWHAQTPFFYHASYL